jgi:hypothetical protein
MILLFSWSYEVVAYVFFLAFPSRMVIFEVKILLDCDIPSCSILMVTVWSASFNIKISACCVHEVHLWSVRFVWWRIVIYVYSVHTLVSLMVAYSVLCEVGFIMFHHITEPTNALILKLYFGTQFIITPACFVPSWPSSGSYWTSAKHIYIYIYIYIYTCMDYEIY